MTKNDILARAMQAIGPRDGDTLTIENAWETVTIVHVVEDGEDGYELDGEPGHYETIGLALVAAFEHLATFERGRCDG